MRHATCAVTFLVGLCLSCQAKSNLTLLVQFDNKHSPESIEEMKRELRSLMTGLEIDWRLVGDVRSGETFPDLVVIRFRGMCQMESLPPYLIDERGPQPLAFTQSTDGNVLPFSQVECDRIRSTIRSAMHGDDFEHADALLGRALGRVLAHELHHVLDNTKRHQQSGINRKSLTAAQLIR